MVSAVKSRPSHYEVLGIAPTASDAEIAEAFAARMGLFGARPWAAAAQMSLAFETLRDPAKRRAYDLALGLRREPPPQPRGWIMAAPQRSAVTFARAAVEQAERVAAVRVEPAPAEVRAEEPPPREVEPAPAEARAEEPPKEEPVLPAEPAPEPEPAIAAWDVPRFAERDPSTELKRAALVVGALILAAGGVGITAGLSAGGEVDDQVTVPLPGAKAKAEVAAASPAPVAKPVEEQAERPVRTEPVEAPPKRAAPSPRIASVDPRPSDRIESIANTLVENPPAVTVAAVEAPASEAAAADLPLPKSVIARTIDRIGYSCGSVASASAVDGAPGVFRIDCSSGQSYRAAPVRGRYHFRRWSGE
ncbi:MAG TPA: hypothetical protein VFK19_12105 [Sphingomicrobium sp.]|nr:hypothetical protein [Sphingomicrobium sp.]